MLIETTEILGGRVNTIKKDGIQYEAGGSKDTLFSFKVYDFN